MIKNTIVVLISSVFLFSCAPQSINVLHVEQVVPSLKNGIYYSLPKTVVSVEVIVKKTDRFKGAYSSFAEQFLGIKNVITTNSTNYEIADINITNYAEPDSTNFYFIECPEKFNEKHKNSVSLELNEAGLVKSINYPSDTKLDAIVSEATAKAVKQSQETSNPPTFTSNMSEKIDTLVEKISIDTFVVERKTLKKTFVEKTSEQKAKEIADVIFKLRESRNNLLTGYMEVNYEKSTLEYMVKDLNKQENDYVTLFTGFTNIEYLRYRFTYSPKITDANNSYINFFRFSSKEGVVENNKEGEYIYITFNKIGTTNIINNYIYERNIRDNKLIHGYYYRIPEYAKVNIMQGGKAKASATMLISQFGVVSSLPPNMTKVQFYPNTGAIKSVEVK